MENFNDGDFRGWEPVGLIKDCWKVDNGELSGDADSLWSPELVLNLGRRNWGNYTIECDAKFIETHDKYKHLDDVHRIELGTRKLAGIEGNIDETILDGVSLALGLEYAVISNHFKGKTNYCKAKPFNTEMGRWYHLKLVMEYDTAKGYVDSEFVCELRVNMSNYGGVSVSFMNSHVHFDNVLMMGGGVPDRHFNIPTTWANIKGNRQ